MLSQLVGEEGSVTGIDMTQEQVIEERERESGVSRRIGEGERMREGGGWMEMDGLTLHEKG